MDSASVPILIGESIVTNNVAFFDNEPPHSRRLAVTVSPEAGVHIDSFRLVPHIAGVITRPVIQAFVTVDEDADWGPRTITITNPDLQQVQIVNGLTIVEAPITDPLRFTSHPNSTPSLAAYCSGLFLLRVDVTGGIGTRSFRWRKDGAFIQEASPVFSGESTGTLSMTVATPGVYDCEVRDGVGTSEISAAFALDLRGREPRFTRWPTSRILCDGSITDVVLEVAAEATNPSGQICPVTLQWIDPSGTPISGATTNTLTVTAQQLLSFVGASGTWTCKATGPLGHVSKAIGVITVVGPPTITDVIIGDSISGGSMVCEDHQLMVDVTAVTGTDIQGVTMLFDVQHRAIGASDFMNVLTDQMVGTMASLQVEHPADTGEYRVSVRYRRDTGTALCGTTFQTLSSPVSITLRKSADFNGVNCLTLQDLFDFLDAWFAGNLAADFNADGALGVSDIFAFLDSFFGMCPVSACGSPAPPSGKGDGVSMAVVDPAREQVLNALRGIRDNMPSGPARDRLESIINATNLSLQTLIEKLAEFQHQ